MTRKDRSRPLAPIAHPSVWTGAEMARRDDWLYRLSAAEVAEIEAAVAPLATAEADLMAIRAEDFPLPRLGPALREIRREILDGRGFAQLRGLPVARLGRLGAAIAFWGIGRHLGHEVASQNANGHLLGHILDLGQSRANPSQRGPYSAETIPYHVDCCDIAGLLCLAPAKAGGESLIASSGAVYNAMLERRPDLVAALEAPVYRDRRDEIPPGKAPWYAIPVFNRHDGLLSTTIEPTYIGSVARHFDGRDPNSAAQSEGVAMVAEVAEALHLDIAFEPGDMQFLNNHAILHSRRGFEDHVAPDRRRHLLRLWLLCHDGRPLPAAYYERHGTPETVPRPGGIVGPDTVLHCPLEPEWHLG